MTTSEAVRLVVALLGFFTAIAAAIPTVIQYRKKSPSKGRTRAVRAFAWMVKPRSILLGIAILAIVSGSLLLQLVRSGDAPHSFAENLLLQLADENAHDCRIIRPQLQLAIASLQCLETKPMKSVTMTLFGSKSDLKQVEGEKVTDLGIEAGDCTIQQVAWQAWRHGRLVCDYSDPTMGARLQWSRYDSDIWLEAEALPNVPPERVYDWWNYDDNGAPANNQLPYPNRYERYISETTGIPASACRRVDGYKNSLAAITCDRPGFTTLFFGYYANEKYLHEALGAPPGKGSCITTYRYDSNRHAYIHRDPEPGRREYELHEKPAGTRDCYEDSGAREVVAQWTNRDKRLFGYAKKTGSSDLEGLFFWWKKKGRFLTD